MRIVVNPVLCQSHGVCTEEAPEVFSLEAGATVIVKEQVVPHERLEAVRNAVQFCPTGALGLVEE